VQAPVKKPDIRQKIAQFLIQVGVISRIVDRSARAAPLES
jgi:hypothetical protein